MEKGAKSATTAQRAKNYIFSSCKYVRNFAMWLLISAVIGVVGGVVGSLFHITVDFATNTGTSHPNLLYLLPVGGLVIALIYKITDMVGKNTNDVIDSIHDGSPVPVMLIPAIFISTAITHLLGGSAGREGAALQIGGGIGYRVGEGLHLSEKSMRLATLCGMSAVFSALFGVPLTATVFALEFISVGVIYYSGFVPCLCASIVALEISLLFGIEPTKFLILSPSLEPVMLVKVCVLAALTAVVSIAFCEAMRLSGMFAKKIKNIYVRIAAGGVLVAGAALALGTRDYCGLGMDIVESAIEQGECNPEAFFFKILFTAVTIGFGYKGGEIVPTFFIGATFGCFAGSLLGIPAGFGAALGLVGMFCGAVNCPIASILLGTELFGSAGLPYFAAMSAIAYVLSGYFGIYSSQKIVYAKTRAEFIDRFTH